MSPQEVLDLRVLEVQALDETRLVAEVALAEIKDENLEVEFVRSRARPNTA